MREDLKTMDDESDEYSELEELIDEAETEINEAESEIEEIKENPEGEYDEDKLSDALDNIVSEYEDSIEQFVENYIGKSVTEFIYDAGLLDKDDFIESVIDSDGWGTLLNSYDGTEEEERVNGVSYHIFFDDTFNGF
jgi:DNA repair exonuclease SbcCD ATPase subunit